MIAGVIQLHVLSVIHSYNKTNCQRQLQLLQTIIIVTFIYSPISKTRFWAYHI